MAGSDPSHREDSRRKRGIDGVAPPSARCRETGAEVDVVDLAASPCDSFLKAEAGCSDRGRRHRETSKTRRSGGDEPSCSPGGRGDGDGDGRNLRRRGDDGSASIPHEAVDLTGDSDEDVIVTAEDPPASTRMRGGERGERTSGKGARAQDDGIVCILDDATPPRTSGGEGGEVSGSGIKCVICMETIGLKNMASTVCGHVFCAECITESLRSSKKCPTCRKSLRANQVHRLYV